MGIHETLGEDLEDLPDFGRGFTRLWERIHKTLGGFMRICKDSKLWEKICETLERICEDSWGFMRIQDFGRGLQGFTRLWERIHEDS